MRKHLALFHMRRVAEPFHVVANIRPIERLAAFGAEYCARVYTLPPRIFHKFFTQLARYYDRAAFALQPYFHTPLFYRIYCYVAQLAYSYTRCAYGLHYKTQPFVPYHVRRVDQPFIFRSAQFPAFVYKGPYSYTRCADGLHDKAQPIVPACISCIYQPFIFRRAQFPVFRYEGFALHL
ncbi:unknown [Clostridium sp. CAG:226]|nr:unknown [Clostridium sp. CAG:226]